MPSESLISQDNVQANVESVQCRVSQTFEAFDYLYLCDHQCTLSRSHFFDRSLGTVDQKVTRFAWPEIEQQMQKRTAELTRASSFALSLKTPTYLWLALCCITYSMMSLKCRN